VPLAGHHVNVTDSSSPIDQRVRPWRPRSVDSQCPRVIMLFAVQQAPELLMSSGKLRVVAAQTTNLDSSITRAVPIPFHRASWSIVIPSSSCTSCSSIMGRAATTPTAYRVNQPRSHASQNSDHLPLADREISGKSPADGPSESFCAFRRPLDASCTPERRKPPSEDLALAYGANLCSCSHHHPRYLSLQTADDGT
jgi:hypothetical protein